MDDGINIDGIDIERNYVTVTLCIGDAKRRILKVTQQEAVRI